jgi:hypothetical protein
MSLVANEIEHGETVAVGNDCFAVDQKRAGGQRRDCRNNDRKAISEVVAVSRDQPDTGLIATGHNSEAVMLNFVQPARSRWRAFGG